jgi:esterase/lipase
MGRSFGAMTATNMAATTIGKSLFKAVVMIAPCFKTYDDKIAKKETLLRFANLIKPYHQLVTKTPEQMK